MILRDTIQAALFWIYCFFYLSAMVGINIRRETEYLFPRASDTSTNWVHLKCMASFSNPMKFDLLFIKKVLDSKQRLSIA